MYPYFFRGFEPVRSFLTSQKYLFNQNFVFFVFSFL
nr:MAG TPA: hypothetical protein [Caudoviricetes sp.]